MTLSTVAPPAGWFPDPGDPAQERWWSGEAWTEHHRAVADAPASPAATIDEHLVEPAQPAYVFDMTAPSTVDETPADVSASAPARPTLPTFEELLAAAAAPHPDEFEDAPPPETEIALPTFEPLVQKSYGAPAPAVTPDVAPAADVAPAPEVAPAADVAATLVAPTYPTAPASPPAPDFEPAFVLPEESPAVAAPALPTPPATPIAAAQPETTPHPAVTPQHDASVPPEVQPLAVPVDAGFVLPSQPSVADQPSMPSVPGLIMPSVPVLETTTQRAEQSARHAEPVEVVPPVPTAPAAPAPVGYTASADVAVANRYRAALHAPEPEVAEEPNPFAAALGPYPAVGGLPAPAGSPSQPGWQGMPLPGSGAAFSPNLPVPGSYTAPPPEGHNKTAWTALGGGALALGLAVFFLFFDRIGLWPALLAIAAVVQGIVGAVHSRKVGTGLGPALGAIGLGLVALGIMVTTVVSWTLFPEFTIEGRVIEQDVMAHASDYGVDVVSAECPDEMSGSAGAEFDCTAYDADGTAYPVDVTVDAEGYFNWTIAAAPATATA